MSTSPTDLALEGRIRLTAAAGRTWAGLPAAAREAVIGQLADALDTADDQLVPIAARETHLPEARLRGELKRTTFQLRLLASAATQGQHLEVRIDPADPGWPMGAPRPDLRRTAVPIGPVLVFAASNFPFAFSILGGDTASALAAGCAVLVKAHEGHPDLSAATARVAEDALRSAGAPEGLLALVSSPQDARTVLTHPEIKAAAFTGSIPAGRALFDLAQSRPEPIPFYGELGSINPVFVTKSAAQTRADEVVEGFIASFTLGAGQFCTKPGVLLAPVDSEVADRLRVAQLPVAAPLLNDRVAARHDQVRAEISARTETLNGMADSAGPAILVANIESVLADPSSFLTECFGPTALVVGYHDEAQLVRFAELIEGQLTATVVGDETDDIVPTLLRSLETKAGRLLWNQWPTGVSVTHAQQHGGPYPASTAPLTTSVGTSALTRFVRAVAWQGFPQGLLPEELRDAPAHAESAADTPDRGESS